jgi:hypothetical protein
VLADHPVEIVDLHRACAAGAHQRKSAFEIQDLDAIWARLEKLNQNGLARLHLLRHR